MVLYQPMPNIDADRDLSSFMETSAPLYVIHWPQLVNFNDMQRFPLRIMLTSPSIDDMLLFTNQIPLHPQDIHFHSLPSPLHSILSPTWKVMSFSLPTPTQPNYLISCCLPADDIFQHNWFTIYLMPPSSIYLHVWRIDFFCNKPPHIFSCLFYSIEQWIPQNEVSFCYVWMFEQLCQIKFWWVYLSQ